MVLAKKVEIASRTVIILETVANPMGYVAAVLVHQVLDAHEGFMLDTLYEKLEEHPCL